MTEEGQPAPWMANPGAYPPPPPPPPPSAPAKPSNGWKATLAIFAALFLVLAVAATACVLSSSSTAKPQAGDTPKGAVQAWGAALVKGDYTTADTYLSSNTRSSGMTSSNFVDGYVITSLTVDSVSASGSSASVEIHYTTTGGSTVQTVLYMVLEDGGWKITEPQI